MIWLEHLDVPLPGVGRPRKNSLQLGWFWRVRPSLGKQRTKSESEWRSFWHPYVFTFTYFQLHFYISWHFLKSTYFHLQVNFYQKYIFSPPSTYFQLNYVFSPPSTHFHLKYIFSPLSTCGNQNFHHRSHWQQQSLSQPVTMCSHEGRSCNFRNIRT